MLPPAFVRSPSPPPPLPGHRPNSASRTAPPLPPGGEEGTTTYEPPTAAGAVWQGCFKDSATARALPKLLSASVSAVGDRQNSVERCRALAVSAGLPYFGLQRFSCYGGSSLAAHEALGRVPDVSCNLSCPGNVTQSCGSLLPASSVWRVVLARSL